MFRYNGKQTNIENESDVEQNCINLLSIKKTDYPEINENEILKILKDLLKTIRKKNISRKPSIIVLTAAVLWHSVFNRPNNDGYIKQEELETKFNGRLDAVRYLRKQLNIEKRKYDTLVELNEDLGKEFIIEMNAVKTAEEIEKWDSIREIIINKIIGRDKYNQSAVESATFLYFNIDTYYTKNEIWEECEEFIDLSGSTPFATYNSDLSRYTDNSEVDEKSKRTPLLFTIENISQKPHKLQLIKEIRERIDFFYNEEEEVVFDELEEFFKENFTSSKYAIECLKFLYDHKDRAYIDVEIWNNVKDKISTLAPNAERIFKVELRRYTDNISISKKRKISLFNAINLESENEDTKFLLIEDIRKKIDNFLKSTPEIEDSSRYNGPKWNDLLKPTIDALKILEGSGKNEEIREVIIKNLNIPKDVIAYQHGIKGPLTELEYQLMWARTALKDLGFIINSEISKWDLTQEGKSNNDDNDTLVKKYKEYKKKDFEIYDDWSDIGEQLKIEYALRDEKVTIFAMTKGIPSSKYTHQLISCKKSIINRLGPFILDPKVSKSDFELSNYGKYYQDQIWDQNYEFNFIAYIDCQIKIKISYSVFEDLEREGFFILWHPNAPFSYFKDKEEGYLVLFKVFTIDNEISEILLNKGRKGRSFYYALEQPVSVNKIESVTSGNQFNIIKQNLINLLKTNNSLIEIIEKPLLIEKPFVWQMIKEASETLAENSGGIFSNSEIKEYILNNYGDVNDDTINSQIIVCTVNHDSRTHYPENKKPRTANQQYDFLFRIEKGKGKLELYDPEKHGIWEIKEDDFGNLIIAKRNEEKSNMEKIKSEYISTLMKKDSKIKLSKYCTVLIEEITRLFNSRKQIILIGPPGTGKTYVAKLVANQLTEGDIKRINLIQFHPEYCYENFIECLQIKSGSNLELEQKTQIFRRICRDALDDKLKILSEYYLNDQNSIPKDEQSEFAKWYEEKIKTKPKYLSDKIPKYVLIIDEINRGDLSRIFGEAIMALEYRNTPIKTMYFDEDDPLIIPDNLYIIGTMNSVDRSIAILDYALRRRFLFYEVKPNREILEEWLEENKSEVKEEILKVFDNLNDDKNGWITETWKDSPQLADNFKIGHSYFFHETKEGFQIECEYSIVPLLLEYMNFSNELIKSFQEKFDLKDPFIIS